MTKERAYEIAKDHVENRKPYEISYIELADTNHVQVQTVFEPYYFDNTSFVTYIDLEEENGDCFEGHTARPTDIDDIAYWIYAMCWNREEL